MEEELQRKVIFRGNLLIVFVVIDARTHRTNGALENSRCRPDEKTLVEVLGCIVAVVGCANNRLVGLKEVSFQTQVKIAPHVEDKFVAHCRILQRPIRFQKQGLAVWNWLKSRDF